MSFSEQDHAYMRRALALAEKVLYLTDPNPRVGCIIVKDGIVIGEGATQKVGGPHAEVVAIQDAKYRGYANQLAGSTFYVTLEPCSHFGRTPPCADALVAHQVGRVVVASLDPNPLVGGKGIAKLREAGIQVDYPLLAEEALAINTGFISRMAAQRPWTWTKLACSLDGKVALNNGVSQWITAEPARRDGQHWRARSSVVLTGIGTILKDNPLLNVRAIATERQPIRAVIDGQFQIPEDAQIFNGSPVWIFTHTDNSAKRVRLQAKNVDIILLPKKGEYIDLAEVWQVFTQRGINEVHVEAGPTLNGALLEAGLIDELLIYMAPKILGPGQSLFNLPALSDLSAVKQFTWVEQLAVGQDLRLRLRAKERWNTLLQAIV